VSVYRVYSVIINIFMQTYERSQNSSVGTAASYGLDDRGVGVRVPVWSRIFSFSRRPDRLWGSPSPLSDAYRG
jgi:glutamine synthetase